MDTQSPERTINRRIKFLTNLELENIRLLSKPGKNDKDKYYYHSELTDHDVNFMERREGQRLEFYTLEELDNIILSSTTKLFVEENRDTVEELLAQ